MGELAVKTEKESSLLMLDELLSSVKGSIIGDSFDSKNFSFLSVVTDSRNVVLKTLFVPLIGEFQDGHKYIPQAIEKGASAVFVAKSAYFDDCEFFENLAEKNPSVLFVLVKNTLTALQNAAQRYVENFPNLIRVSVTGSSGKTTTKEIAASILRQKYSVVCNKGNLNSETGLPLSCFEIKKEHQVALLEMGMNRKNEIEEIARVFKPQFAAITNIGTAHIGKLGSRKKIAKEKKKIFSYVKKTGACVIPYGDDFAKFLSRGVKGRIVYYGDECSMDGIEFVCDEGIDGSLFKVDGLLTRLPLPGKYNYLNALAAVQLARLLNVPCELIKKGIEEVKPLGGRSNILKGFYTILDDCYNANPDSMEKAVEFSTGLTGFEKKIFVLGSMLELGEESLQAHKAAVLVAFEGGADMIVLVGKEMIAGLKEAEKIASSNKNLRLICFEEHDDAVIQKIASLIKEFASSKDFILLKGSNGIGLGRLIPLLNVEGEKNA